MKRERSSIGEVSYHGIATSAEIAILATATECDLCSRFGLLPIYPVCTVAAANEH